MFFLFNLGNFSSDATCSACLPGLSGRYLLVPDPTLQKRVNFGRNEFVLRTQLSFKRELGNTFAIQNVAVDRALPYGLLYIWRNFPRLLLHILPIKETAPKIALYGGSSGYV